MRHHFDFSHVTQVLRIVLNLLSAFVAAPSLAALEYSGASNEKIIQNHLHITSLNVFYHLNGRYRHIFIPRKFFICSDFLAKRLVIRKL